ncbi:MAG: hypothetical protein IJS82_01620 [Paludibacteraceae bacterium]|nr:hypothetical protein [Paludibacteraceae bacterium]
MRNDKFLLVAMLVGLTCNSCKLKSIVTVNDYYPPTSGRMQIYQTGQALPDNIVRIGSIVVGESGMTPTKKCTYEACMQLIEDEAKKKGAELVYLVKVKEPSAWGSTCYNITAEMYRYAR